MTKPYKYLNEKTGRMVSRQRIWQLRRVAEGGCMTCGQPRETDCLSKLFCQKHAMAHGENGRYNAHNWADVNWNLPDVEIARMVGVTPQAVWRQRRKVLNGKRQ